MADEPTVQAQRKSDDDEMTDLPLEETEDGPSGGGVRDFDSDGRGDLAAR